MPWWHQFTGTPHDPRLRLWSQDPQTGLDQKQNRHWCASCSTVPCVGRTGSPWYDLRVNQGNTPWPAPTSSPWTSAPWPWLRHSGAPSELLFCASLATAAPLVRMPMQTISWTPTTPWRQRWEWTTDLVAHRGQQCPHHLLTLLCSFKNTNDSDSRRSQFFWRKFQQCYAIWIA